MPYRVIYAVQRLYTNAEDITSFITCLIIHININWTDKIVSALFSISASLIAAFLVSVIKKTYIAEWFSDKLREYLNKKRNDKKN
jgi:uncharacterized protein involved in cysteine biosynthesis